MKLYQLIRLLFIGVVLFMTASCATSRVAQYSTPSEAVLLEPVPDPLEPFNRSMQTVNIGLQENLVNPLVQVWRFITPQFLRDRISNLGNTLTYPQRFFAHLLQGEFFYSWVDTQRFAVNLTAGGLGLFDPATKWGLPTIDGSFKQTLAAWGVGEGCYLNLPVWGPGTARDAVGKLLDMPFDLLWWCPASNGVRYAASGVSFANNHTDYNTALQQLAANYNHYELSKTLAVLASRAQAKPYIIDRSRNDYDADESLGALALAPTDDGFFYEGRERRVRLGNGSKLPYTCWPLDGARRIVVILPGIGTHRRSDQVYAFAELFRREGCAVIALSSSFLPDYFSNLPELNPPGFFNEDAARLGPALAGIVKDFQKHYRTAGDEELLLFGYSLGGINALHLAAQEDENGCIPGGLKFSRYLALNPPPRISEVIKRLDQFYKIPDTWPAEEAPARMEDLAMRMLAAMQPSLANPPSDELPLTRDESEFLLGLSIRVTLAGAIQAFEKEARTGVLKEDADACFNRNNLFAEAISFSFEDYLNRIVLPWYQQHGHPGLTAEELAERVNLTSVTAALAANPRIRVFENRNDLMIDSADAAWFETAFGENARLFDRGSHLGTMPDPGYQQLLIQALLK